jgi:hypothetical protein
MSRKCSARKGSGEPCPNWAIRGADVCSVHGGMAPQVRAKAAVRNELMNWGLNDLTVDPGETLLRLVSQSSRRAAELSAELERMVMEHGLHDALVGTTIVVDNHGDEHEVGEYVRGLTQLEATERDRCANFAAKAIAAGLAERTVRLAEKQGAVIAEVLRRVFADPSLGLSETQRAAVPDVIRRHLALTA